MMHVCKKIPVVETSLKILSLVSGTAYLRKYGNANIVADTFTGSEGAFTSTTTLLKRPALRGLTSLQMPF